MYIRYTMRRKSTRILGPGSRAALWVWGCPRRCEGCIAQDMNEGLFYSETPRTLCDWFLASGAEGLTISGGEPFHSNAAALAQMIDLIRERKPDTSVVIYSGYMHEELRSGSPGQQALLRRTDVLIDGPYIRERDDGRRFGVGSDNQRVIRLTGRISQQVLDAYYSEENDRQIVLQPAAAGVQLIGVPNPRQLNLWKTIFKKQGGDIHAA